MVKKLTKAALLAAATAFLLAGFPACSSDDDDGDSNPTEVTAELDAEVGELTAETPKTVEATVKVDGDTFSTTAKSIEPDGKIPEDSFALEADDAEVSAATLVEWVDDSTAKISFTVTANEDSEGGRIHALIKAGTLTTCTEVVKTTSVIYTVKGKEPPAGLTKTVRFFNDANATTAIHTVTVATGEKLTEAQLEAAESRLTAPEGKEFEKWDDDTTAAITEDKDFHAIWKDAEATGTTYAWNFQAEGLESILSYTNNKDNKPQLDAAGTYESTPAGLTLNLPEGGVFNKVDTAMSSNKATAITASNGAVEPDANSELTVTVRGPFTAVMLCSANSDSDKTDRYAYIKVNDEEVCAPYKETDTLHGAGEKLSYTYNGDNEVTVAFGVSSGYVRIYDIKITTENGDGEGKTDGEVKSSATFEPGESVTVTFEELNLESSATPAITEGDAVVSVETTGEDIKISAKAPGSAKITVTEGDKTATIEVTVSGTGKITIVKITKYVNTAEIFTVTNGVLMLNEGMSYVYTLNFDSIDETNGDFTDAEWITGSKKNSGVTQWSSSGAVKNGEDNDTYDSPNALNSGSADRTLTVKVSGVKTFKVYGANTTKDRSVTVAVDNESAVTYKHDGRSGNNAYDFVSIPLDGNEHTLVLTGTKSETIKLTAIELLSQ